MTSATVTPAQRKRPRAKGGRSRTAKRPAPRGKSAAHGISAAGVPIVGIGASAGGLEALSEFFDAMPVDSGLAFVIVLHLDPHHKSQMAALVGRHTKMAAVEIVDRMVVEANRVYVIAPDHYLTIRKGILRLVKSKEPRSQRRPADVFFAALAEDQQERAICIVLSGTGSDGSTALPGVKANGGLVLAQEPRSAKFDGMPQAAIATGTVDHVLTPKDMPAALLRRLRQGAFTAPAASAGMAPAEQQTFDRILDLLRDRTGHDFRSYKLSTVLRRIQRRMGLNNATTLRGYAGLLDASRSELETLAQDLMVTVTGFFRDGEAWEALDQAVIGSLVASKPAGSSIRVWTPGCASGEEPYSIAMLLSERAAAANKEFDIKIFATDSKDRNLTASRTGVFTQGAVAAVSPQRRERFFNPLDGSYQIKRELRDLIVFASHNLLRDPPFSRLDLISCRNLLIYLDPEAQKRVLAVFHFALRDGGSLFLGTAETVGKADDLFETVSKKWRFYRRVGPGRRDVVDFSETRVPTLEDKPGRRPELPARPPVRSADIARQALLERYAPASVLIDAKCRVFYFHGATGNYLEPPTGEPTQDLLAMARPELRAQLRKTIREAVAGNQGIVFAAQVRQDGSAVRPVTVAVAPLDGAGGAGNLLVSFETEQKPAATLAPAGPAGDAESAATLALEEELKTARSELQSTIEQMEAANEELKAANEEATSANEELQSSNEELETSKEELQSFNEELHTVNSQLQAKIVDLDALTNDLHNLLEGTEIATIFLDADLRIKWFSPATRELFNLLASDIGRPISHFSAKFVDELLLTDAETVLKRLTRIEAEIPGDAGRWYLRRMLPYRTRDDRIAGVVVTFTDITERKRASDEVNEARIYADAIVQTVRQPLLVLDTDLRVMSANDSFLETFKVDAKQTQGRLLYELGNHQWDIPTLRILLEDVLPNDRRVEDFEVAHEFESIGQRDMLLNARRLSRGAGRPELILLAIEDITERRRGEEHRQMLTAELSHRVKNTLATIQSIASQTLRRSGSLDRFKEAFEGRLLALARAHDLLIRQDWEGIDISELAKQTLEPYLQGFAERMKVDGSKVTLTPQSGVALALILNELATNAAKHGALSTPGGNVELSWRLDGEDANSRHLYMRWAEAGGPAVKPPDSRGFGTTFIERAAVHEFRGEAKLEFREQGLRCELILPYDAPGAAVSDGDRS